MQCFTIDCTTTVTTVLNAFTTATSSTLLLALQKHRNTLSHARLVQLQIDGYFCAYTASTLHCSVLEHITVYSV
jgi:hypothetical protein